MREVTAFNANLWLKLSSIDTSPMNRCRIANEEIKYRGQPCWSTNATLFGPITSIEQSAIAEDNTQRVYFISAFGCVWSADAAGLADPTGPAGSIIPPCAESQPKQSEICVPRIVSSSKQPFSPPQAKPHPVDPGAILIRQPLQSQWSPAGLFALFENGVSAVNISARLERNKQLIHVRRNEFSWLVPSPTSSPSMYSVVASGFSSYDTFFKRSLLDGADPLADLFVLRATHGSSFNFDAAMLPCAHSFILSHSHSQLIAKIEAQCSSQCGNAVATASEANSCRTKRNFINSRLTLRAANITSTHDDGDEHQSNHAFHRALAIVGKGFSSTCLHCDSIDGNIDDAMSVASDDSGLIAAHCVDKRKQSWSVYRSQRSGLFSRRLRSVYTSGGTKDASTGQEEGITVPEVGINRVQSSEGVVIATNASSSTLESVVSHDHGAHWHNLGLSLANSDFLTFFEGTQHIRWSFSIPPVHSSKFAPGVVVGNGRNFTDSDESSLASSTGYVYKSMFLSIDFGRTFSKVSDFMSAYDVSAFGSVIAFAPHRLSLQRNVSSLSITRDGGSSVQQIALNVTLKEVHNVVAGPKHDNDVFHVIGLSQDQFVTIVTIDTGNLASQRRCKENDGMQRRDVGCVFGRKASAIFRAQGDDCALRSSDQARIELGESCDCQRQRDFECAFGYENNTATDGVRSWHCKPIDGGSVLDQCPLTTSSSSRRTDGDSQAGVQRAPGNQCAESESRGDGEMIGRRGAPVGVVVLLVMLIVGGCVAAVVFLWNPIMDMLPDGYSDTINDMSDRLRSLVTGGFRPGFRSPSEPAGSGSFAPLSRDDVL